jgi:N-acetylneuraminic acid mutarotase
MKSRKGLLTIWQWTLALVLVLGLAGVSFYAYAAGGTWSTKADMLQGSLGQAGVINGKLYIAGGSNAYWERSLLQVYDPATNTWTAKSPLLIPSAGGGCGAIAGKLYLVAGEAGGNWGNWLQVYDSATDTWTTKAPVDIYWGGMASGVIDGKLYVAGGATPYWGTSGDRRLLNVLEVYDPATDTWTTKAPMPTARDGCQGGVIDGKLYVVGGDLVGQLSDKLEVYDPAADTWTTKAPMPTARFSFAAGVVNGILYAAGELAMPGFST